MTLEEIKSEIRVLPASDKIKLHKWLDYEMAPDFSSSDFCSRIGVDRSLEIRQAIEQKSEIPVRQGRLKTDVSLPFSSGPQESAHV